MLWTIFVILLVLWLFGLVSAYTLGGFIHLLLIIAVVVLVIQLMQGRRSLERWLTCIPVGLSGVEAHTRLQFSAAPADTPHARIERGSWHVGWSGHPWHPGDGQMYSGMGEPRAGCGRVIGRVEGPLHGRSPPALPTSAWSGALPRDAAHTEIFMASYTSGELVWDTTEATAPRWILFLEGPPGAPPLRLDPRDSSTPQTASTRQLVVLIGTTFRKETGEQPLYVVLTPITYRQRLRFRAMWK